MKYRRLILVWLLFTPLLVAMSACAEEVEESGTFGSLWEQTRDMAGSAWEDARQWFTEQEIQDNSFQRLWQDILPKLDEALELRDRHEQLPEDAWFGEDQVSNREQLNELMDESIALLSTSPAQRYRERIRELEEEIRQAREEIAEFRTRRIAAPQDSLWKKTVDEYDGAIQERQARIEDYIDELQTIKRQFAGELQSLGLDLSDEQLEFLLSTVVGDDLIEMGVAFDNVKAITIQLEQLLVNSQESLDSGRRYYGMYLILLKMLERMQSQLITAVNDRYIPQIDTIIDKTKTLMAETRELQQRSPASREVLTANLEAQSLTLRAAGFYRDYLLEQSNEVAVARRSLMQDIAVAENTYETVKVSGELVALMQSSQRLLDDLLQRQVPPLRPFQNLELKREFEKLTVRLRQGEPA